MPLCSTGIIKREIEVINATELNWQPIKIANNTSANVTTTTIPTTKISSSSIPSTTPSTITPRISRRRTSTTTETVSTQAITEKYAERISTDNVTEASVIDSQPVTNKDNLDDDAEVINFGDGDGVTTEEHRFDLSR